MRTRRFCRSVAPRHRTWPTALAYPLTRDFKNQPHHTIRKRRRKTLCMFITKLLRKQDRYRNGLDNAFRQTLPGNLELVTILLTHGFVHLGGH
jgi:hypothetical protein